LTKVFLLALAASLDAVLVATVVLLLARPHPERQLLAFWLGAIVLSTAIGLFIVLALGKPGLQVNQHGSASPGSRSRLASRCSRLPRPSAPDSPVA